MTGLLYWAWLDAGLKICIKFDVYVNGGEGGSSLQLPLILQSTPMLKLLAPKTVIPKNIRSQLSIGQGGEVALDLTVQGKSSGKYQCHQEVQTPQVREWKLSHLQSTRVNRLRFCLIWQDCHRLALM